MDSLKIRFEIGEENGEFGRIKKEFEVNRDEEKRGIDEGFRFKLHLFLISLTKGIWHIPFKGSIVVDERNMLYVTINDHKPCPIGEIDVYRTEKIILDRIQGYFRKLDKGRLEAIKDNCYVI